MTLSHEVLQDGTVRITIVGTLPQPSIAENPKWPWTPWNSSYSRQQLDKDGLRVLQSLANAKLVDGVLASRAARREEEKAAKAPAQLVAAATQPQAPAQTVVAEVPAPSPTTAPAPASAPKSRKGKKS